jgi:hypothetical protein
LVFTPASRSRFRRRFRGWSTSCGAIWEKVRCGEAPNEIPSDEIRAGIVRCQDNQARDRATELVKRLVEAVASEFNA